jgi:hypothetical protein
MLLMLAFTACSSDNDERADAPRFYNVTLTASMGDAETRALSEGTGNVITASFAAGDKVKVLKSDGTEVGELTAKTAEPSTTLEGTISGTFSVNEELTFRYRSATANYDGQVGTLDGIAANQDYEEGTLTVTSTDPLTFNSNSVTLLAKQSITKFTFKNGTNPVSVKSFGIAAVGLVQSIATNGTETAGAVTGTLGTATSDVYIALRNNTDAKQTYAFTIKDNAGNWYITTKKAKLTYGKNYAVDIALTPLPTLTSSSAVGTIGVVDGLPAIVVEINSTKVAVALMNTGALCPEAYGTYYIFSQKASGLSDGWYVPTKDELYVKENDVVTGGLAKISNAWTTQNGVNGRLFTISEGKTFFLPAAGFIDNDNDEGQETAYTGKELVSTYGFYWSQTEATPSSMAYSLQFSSANINVFSEYEVNALPVRPFHALN